MTIPCNKNITKLLNSYTIGITITLQCLLQSTKRALNVQHPITTVVPNKGPGFEHKEAKHEPKKFQVI